MPHYAVGLLFVISAQLIGFGLAGIILSFWNYLPERLSL
jgi:hypothetical protein